VTECSRPFLRPCRFGPDVEDASPKAAFYFDAIYNYTALLFLLDSKDKPMGGSAYPALARHGLHPLLKPVQSLLDEPVGDTTFGGLILAFRNNAIVHSKHSYSDLDKVSARVDLGSDLDQRRWLSLLQDLRARVATLEVDVICATGRPQSDFGFE
jgi:hypothetical protein